MPQNQAIKIQPGRELDVAVAEILGWNRENREAFRSFMHMDSGTPPLDTEGWIREGHVWAMHPPKYSRDHQLCGELQTWLAEHFRDGLDLDITCSNKKWFVREAAPGYVSRITSLYSNINLALCDAVLRVSDDMATEELKLTDNIKKAIEDSE